MILFNRTPAGLLFILLILGISASGCSPEPYRAADYGADAKRTGVYPGAAPTLQEEVWRFEAEGNRLNKDYLEIYASPVLADGVAYVPSFGLYALDLNTGEEVWVFETGSSIDNAPAVANETVFFDGGGTVYAVDVHTGEEKWQYEEGSLATHPLVHERGVYFGDLDGHLYGVDAETGAEKWMYNTGSAVRHAPALSDGMVYVANHEGELFAVHLESGEKAWSFRSGVEGWASGSPVVSGETVYVGVRDRLYALNKMTGETQWTVTIGPIHRSPIVHAGVVYVRSSSDGIVFAHALDARTGEETWRSQFDTEPRVTAPVLCDGVLYFGSADGLYAVDAETGEQTAFFPVDEGVQSSPVILNGRIYFSSGRYLYAVN